MGEEGVMVIGAGATSFSGYWYVSVCSTGVSGARSARWTVPFPGVWEGVVRKGFIVVVVEDMLGCVLLLLLLLAHTSDSWVIISFAVAD